MNDCLFCKIAKKEMSSKIEYEDSKVIVIHDLHPKAPLHVLVVPKEHVLESMKDLEEHNKDLLFHMFATARDVAAKHGADKLGYKLLFNVGKGGGQTIMHLHLHVLGKTSESDSLPKVAE